ncbi:MAG: hypothetical protein JSS81_29830 [Acidobacteria bacterium]|nr:hypothetical protein [Acidobacteriota bacterium]
MRWIKIISITVTALAVSAFGLAGAGFMQTSPARPNDLTDVVVDFEAAQLDEKVWSGTTGGGVSGSIRIEILDPPPAALRGVRDGGARWQVIAGNESFTAVTRGKINSFNGTLVMSGLVTSGANAGAPVEVRGQIVAINPQGFAGTIRVVRP